MQDFGVGLLTFEVHIACYTQTHDHPTPSAKLKYNPARFPMKKYINTFLLNIISATENEYY